MMERADLVWPDWPDLPFNVGAQSFILLRDNVPVLDATSLKEIKNECPCGIYNFNAYVGTVPESPIDALDDLHDAIASPTQRSLLE